MVLTKKKSFDGLGLGRGVGLYFASCYVLLHTKYNFLTQKLHVCLFVFLICFVYSGKIREHASSTHSRGISLYFGFLGCVFELEGVSWILPASVAYGAIQADKYKTKQGKKVLQV